MPVNATKYAIIHLERLELINCLTDPAILDIFSEFPADCWLDHREKFIGRPVSPISRYPDFLALALMFAVN
jgi:hypothetical protein